MGVGPIAADAGAHQHRPGQHGRFLEEDFLVGQIVSLGDPLEHGIQRDLLHDETAAAPRIVQLAEVPLPEEVIGPLVHRVVEVVGAGIDGQLVQHRRIEHGLQQQHRIGGLQDRHRSLDEVVVAADGHARPANEQRNGPHPFVRVRLDMLLGAEDGDRPVAQVIVQVAHRAGDDAIDLVPRPALLQHRLEAAAEKEGLKEGLVALVKQQVAMELAIAGQQAIERQREDRLGLVRLPEGIGAAAKVFERPAQEGGDGLPGRFAAFRCPRNQAEHLVEVAKKPGVRRPGREVQVSEHVRNGIEGIVTRLHAFYRRSFRGKGVNTDLQSR